VSQPNGETKGTSPAGNCVTHEQIASSALQKSSSTAEGTPASSGHDAQCEPHPVGDASGSKQLPKAASSVKLTGVGAFDDASLLAPLALEAARWVGFHMGRLLDSHFPTALALALALRLCMA
jgi:hypothetical protein